MSRIVLSSQRREHNKNFAAFGGEYIENKKT